MFINAILLFFIIFVLAAILWVVGSIFVGECEYKASIVCFLIPLPLIFWFTLAGLQPWAIKFQEIVEATEVRLWGGGSRWVVGFVQNNEVKIQPLDFVPENKKVLITMYDTDKIYYGIYFPPGESSVKIEPVGAKTN